MRTTVDLADELLTQARRRAADEGTTLTALLADACASGSRGVCQAHRLGSRCLATAVARSRGSTLRCWMPRTTTVLLPHVNVLLAGFRSDHVHHRPARALPEEARSQTATPGIGDVAPSSLVRRATNPGVFAQPDTVHAVLDCIDVLLEPPTQVLRAGAGHWACFAACAGS